jgi:hypothetical protein
LTTESSSFSDLVRLLAQAAERELQAHPDLETLSAYRRGELSAEERAGVEGHLTWCRDDVAVLLALEDTEVPVDEEAVDEAEKAAVWQRLREQIHEGRPASIPGEPRLVPRPWPVSRSLNWGLAAAAVLALAAMGWGLHLRWRLNDALQPRANVILRDLDPPVAERDEAASVVTLEFEPKSGRVVLLLNPSKPLTEPEYEIRILSEDGRRVWNGYGLVPTEFGNFTFELSRGFFSPGSYLIEIHSQGRGDEPPRDTYRILIEEGSSGLFPTPRGR